MSKQIIYSVKTGQIAQWQDTDALNYPEAPQEYRTMEVTDYEWAKRDVLTWVVNGQIVDAPPEEWEDLASPDNGLSAG